MSIVTDDTDRWLVSARANGEVLTTGAGVPGLELYLLGSAAGYRPEELASWLQGLAEAVRDSVSATPPGDPVPAMLRESLGGLLFSRAELWSRGAAPVGIALVGGADRIGFGWVGEASVEVYRDGARDDSEWVSIRDAQGREARAWCGSPGHDVRIELAWSPGPPLDVVRLEAHWTAPRSDASPIDPGEEAVAIDGSSAAEVVRREASAPLEPPPPAGGEPPSSGVARWLAQHLRWGRSENEAPPSADDAPEDRSISMAAEPPASSSEGPHVEDLVEALAADISSRFEPSGTPTQELEGAEDPARRFEVSELPADLPERIPPTPEHESLTARAIAPSLESSVVGREATSEIGEGAPMSAADTALAPARRAPPRQPEWPDVDTRESSPVARNWKPAIAWGALVLVLFGVGWAVGSFQAQGGPEQVRRPSGFLLFLRQVGLAPPRFQVAVTSRPAGAWIAVDGKDLTVRAPATLELAPGEHRVELSFPDLGSSPYLVRGAKNDRVSLDVPMWGSLDVVATEPNAVVNVALDDSPLGFVPVRLDSVAPGPHELRFSGPNTESWVSTIEVRVGEVREVLAYPLQSPATGLLQVRATQSAEGASVPLDGAHVWVDGAHRGVTPLTLELPRGPHSVRVAHQKEEAPIQVIDLPGGNQRFATFEFGLRSDLPALALKAPATFTVEEPALVSATLNDIAIADVREMWLHVRTPENRWRRYPMTLLDAQGSVVGAAPFPIALIGDDGQQLYYVSALTAQGDEIFTEMQSAHGAARPHR